jgi:hypothetical protein
MTTQLAERFRGQRYVVQDRVVVVVVDDMGVKVDSHPHSSWYMLTVVWGV